MIKFHIPGFYEFYDLNYILYNFMSGRFKRYFREDIQIGSVYGSFPGAIWNGGRPFLGECDEQTVVNVIDYYDKIGVPVRFTFTNTLVDKSHLSDRFCNMILQIANNGKNEIIVNNPILEDYLRTNYPNFKYILSTTSGLRDLDKINELSDVYDYIVLNYNDNKNESLLSELKNKDKIEILVNELCAPNCPNRKAHYDFQSRKQLGLEPKDKVYECNAGAPTNFYAVMGDEFKRNHIITPDELYGKYVNMGFSNFKIQGRGLPMVYTMESYLTYMVKPEYKDFIRYEILSGQ